MNSSHATEYYQRFIQVKHVHFLLGNMIMSFIFRKTEDQRKPGWASKLGWWNCQLKDIFCSYLLPQKGCGITTPRKEKWKVDAFLHHCFSTQSLLYHP